MLSNKRCFDREISCVSIAKSNVSSSKEEKMASRYFPNYSRVIAAAMVASIVQPALANEYSFQADHVLGTEVKMTVEASSQEVAQFAWEQARSEISRLEKIFSSRDSHAELAVLNDRKSLEVSSELSELLTACKAWHEKTNGALHCGMGKLVKVWKNSEKSGVLPSDSEIKPLLDAVALNNFIDIKSNSFVQLSEGVELNVEAVAKGKIIDKASQAALAIDGVQGVVLNIGGDIRTLGKLSESAVKVGVSSGNSADNSTPDDLVRVANAAIATSGAGRRDFNISGQTYSHIVSPFNGRPQEIVDYVSVIAPSAEEADALATAFSVMGISQSLLYANTHEGIETFIFSKGGTLFKSKGWEGLRVPVEVITAAEAGVENPWVPDWKMRVKYSVPEIDISDYEYPYIVAWVTDAENKPVKHLLMLGDSPRWIEENYVHWRRVGRKQPAVIDHVARPTKPPGVYDIEWDGVDDHGRPVEQGEYILHIEASREHGGHQYVKLPVNLSNTADVWTVDPGSELGKISIDFSKTKSS